MAPKLLDLFETFAATRRERMRHLCPHLRSKRIGQILVEDCCLSESEAHSDDAMIPRCLGKASAKAGQFGRSQVVQRPGQGF